MSCTYNRTYNTVDFDLDSVSFIKVGFIAVLGLNQKMNNIYKFKGTSCLFLWGFFCLFLLSSLLLLLLLCMYVCVYECVCVYFIFIYKLFLMNC